MEALQHEMGLLKLRELKILEKIKEYEDMDPDTLITSSVLDMRVPGKVGKTGKKEDGKVQTMGMYSRDTPFARILKLQDALYKRRAALPLLPARCGRRKKPTAVWSWNASG